MQTKEKEIENNKEAEEEYKRKVEYQTNNFISGLMPFGSRDIEVAIETAIDVGEDGDWVAECVQNFIDDTGVKLDDIDVVCCVYDAILQICRNEIERETDTDIWNDLDKIVEAYGNYMCTSYDGKEKAVKDTLEIINQIDKEDRSKMLEWFTDQLEDMY